MSAESVPLEYYLASPPQNGYSPVESADWTGVQMLGLGCLTAEGFVPRQLKNAPEGISATHSAILHDGDLLVSRANTRDLVGLAGIYRNVGSLCIYPDLMMRLEPSSNCDPEFLEILLRSPDFRRILSGGAQGTSESMVKISAQTLRSLRVPRFTVVEQHAIVKVLKSVAESERVARSEIAKMRTIRDGLIAGLLGVANSEEAGSGKSYVACGDIMTMAGGFPLALAHPNPAGRYPIMSSGGLSGMGDREITSHSVIVIGRVGEGAGSVFFTSGPAWVTDNALWVKYVAAGWMPEFLAIYLKWYDLQKLRSQTGQPLITQGVINGIKIPFFDLAEQRKIVRVHRAWEEEASIPQLWLDKLRLLRDGIIEDLVSGKVRAVVPLNVSA